MALREGPPRRKAQGVVKTGDRVALWGTVSFERAGFVTVRWDNGQTTSEWGADLEMDSAGERPEGPRNGVDSLDGAR